MIGWVCLFGGSVAALFSVNAWRPVRGRFIGPSFAGAGLVAELGAFQALACLFFAALFWLYGAAASLPGVVGLVLYGVGIGAAVALELRALDSVTVVAKTLETVGPISVPPRLSWRLRPVALSHREVVCAKNLSYGPAGLRNLLDVYRPRANGTLRPVLFQIHGGAWVIGSKNVQARPLLLHMAAAGWVCVAINYRLSPRAPWPAHLDDCKLALRWVREHIAEHSGDPYRIVLTGGSAGGHLTAMLGLSSPEGVAGCVPFYAPYDLASLFAPAHKAQIPRWICRNVFGCRHDERAPLLAASPISMVHAGAPPFLSIHGTADTLVPVDQARAFTAALRAVSKEPVLYAELPGAIHAFDMFRGSRTAATVAAVHRFAEWAVSRAPASPVAHQADRAAAR